MFFVIYKVTCIINGKSYIGLSSNFPQRKKSHISDTKLKRTKSLLHKAARKYTWEAFTWEILVDNLSFEEAVEKEKYYILQHQSHYIDGNGYNMTYGGEGTPGYMISESTKEKLRNAPFRKCPKYRQQQRENTLKQMTLEFKQGMSERAKEYAKHFPNPMLGKNHSEDSKKRMGETKREKFKNGEIVAYRKDKPLLETSKQKLRDKAILRLKTEYSIYLNNNLIIKTKCIKEFCKTYNLNYKSLKSILFHKTHKLKYNTPIKYKDYHFIRHES